MAFWTKQLYCSWCFNKSRHFGDKYLSLLCQICAETVFTDVEEESWCKNSIGSISVGSCIDHDACHPCQIIFWFSESWIIKFLWEKVTINEVLAVRKVIEMRLTWNWGTKRTSWRTSWWVSATSPKKCTGRLVLFGGITVDCCMGLKFLRP